MKATRFCRAGNIRSGFCSDANASRSKFFLLFSLTVETGGLPVSNPGVPSQYTIALPQTQMASTLEQWFHVLATVQQDLRDDLTTTIERELTQAMAFVEQQWDHLLFAPSETPLNTQNPSLNSAIPHYRLVEDDHRRLQDRESAGRHLRGDGRLFMRMLFHGLNNCPECAFSPSERGA